MDDDVPFMFLVLVTVALFLCVRGCEINFSSSKSDWQAECVRRGVAEWTEIGGKKAFRWTVEPKETSDE